MKWKDFKSLAVKDEGEEKNKRKIENLVVFIIILIITIIAINMIWNGNSKKTEQKASSDKQLAMTENTTLNNGDNGQNAQNELKQNLEGILSKMSGVGKVNVLITYSESSEVVAMYNQTNKDTSTEESDQTGGTRKIQDQENTKEVIFKEENGQKVPVTQKVVLPKIEGAIITAEGAGDTMVKANIIQAVEAATGLASHKIQVFQMNS